MIINVRIVADHRLPATFMAKPGRPVVGDVYYDSLSQMPYRFDGTVWVQLLVSGVSGSGGGGGGGGNAGGSIIVTSIGGGGGGGASGWKRPTGGWGA